MPNTYRRTGNWVKVDECMLESGWVVEYYCVEGGPALSELVEQATALAVCRWGSEPVRVPTRSAFNGNLSLSQVPLGVGVDAAAETSVSTERAAVGGERVPSATQCVDRPSGTEGLDACGDLCAGEHGS